MKGDAEIITALNDVLTAELTAINQYFVHAKMCQNWGYQKMAGIKKKEAMEEMRDADLVIDRILYLEGIPNMQRLYPVQVGESVPEMHQVDLALEKAAVERLNKGIKLCRDKGDNGTRTILEQILKGEEEAVDWLEGQLGIIEEIGKERYLAEQIHE